MANIGIRHTRFTDSDFVWGDGSFLQAPEGKQKKC
jgi:hypothetical protein